MPMFDLEDMGKVTLEDNHTSKEEFLKAKRVDELNAKRNTAALPESLVIELSKHGLNQEIPLEIFEDTKDKVAILADALPPENIIEVLKTSKIGNWLNSLAVACTISGENVPSILTALVSFFTS